MAEVETSREGAVLTITLNRPDVLNAFNADDAQGARSSAEGGPRPDVRAVVITGAGRGFCVGQDLTEFREAPGDIGSRLRETYHPNVLAIRALEKPVIAAVNGPAAGAGMSLRVRVRSAHRRRLGELRAGLHQHRARPGLGRLLLRHAHPRRGARVRVAHVWPQAHCGRGARRGASSRRSSKQTRSPLARLRSRRNCAALPTRGIGMTKRLIDHALERDARAAARTGG